MATEQFDITSLFQPSGGATTIRRKDSGVSDAINQIHSYKGFDGKRTTSSRSAPQPVTLTFTPSTGSTCISLYPRTKTFTYTSSLSSDACVATCENSQKWHISAVPSSPDSEIRRFTFDRVDDDDEVVEAFRRCSVALPQQTAGHARTPSSQDIGRRLSVGHYSSGLSGFMLPHMPTRA